MRHLLGLVIVLLGMARGGSAQTEDPILRIETGMHTAAIRGIDVDAAERFLLTGSHDKTARLWSLEDGSLLRVFRPPIGQGGAGKVYAVALSPDGDTVALGGWLKIEGIRSVYLFDRRTGRVLRRISGLPNVVLHLAFDRDGRRLVATLGGKNGIRLFETASGKELARDSNYEGDSYGASFDNAGRLVTTSYDGKLRLYGRSGERINEVASPGGHRPFSIAFSPDGTRLAVGYENSTRIDIFSGTDLKWLFKADTQGTNLNLSRVAWSRKGSVLFAAGRYLKEGTHPIRHFSDGADPQSAWRDLNGPQNAVRGLRGLTNDRLAFGSADPAWGVLDTNGEKFLWRDREIADVRDLDQGFLTNSAGDRFHFSFKPLAKRPASFSVLERRVTMSPPSDTSLRPPRTIAEDLTVTGWKHSRQPELNETPLPLKALETSHSLAIAPDAKGFILGADWTLRSFSRDGEERWSIPVPGAAWAVNITGDGRLVLAAFGDGTIRWFRYDNGRELLAFFPHRDGQRWVLWTPSGYYDASVGGEDLIGWHINNGPDKAADFYSAWHFRDRYHRPDIVDLVLKTLDEDEAIRQAGGVPTSKALRPPPPPVRQVRPPVVTILDPAQGTAFNTPTIRVRVNVRSPSGAEVDKIRASVDGQLLGKNRGEVRGEGARTKDFLETLEIPVPPRDCTVEIIAEAGGKTSEPARLKLKWTGQDPKIEARLFVLAVGVSDYANESFQLDFAAKDADDVARAFDDFGQRHYSSVDTRVLTNADASYGNILGALEDLQQDVTDQDFVVLFLAGHGINDGEYYFLPHNADLNRKYSTLLGQNQIQSILMDMPGRVLLFLDTCRAGSLMSSGLAKNNDELRRRLDITRFVNAMTYNNTGVVIYSASSSRQFSMESAEWGNGIFTKVLIEGLKGQADANRDGQVMTSELEGFLAREVKRRTGDLQVPVMAKPGGVPDLVLLRSQ